MKPFKGAELLEAVHEAASLVPPPDSSILDDAALSQLLAGMGRDAADARLDGVARRIADLLTMLDAPDADPVECEEAAHDLVGITGLMGLTALSTCLTLLETAEDRGASEAALREAAMNAILALGRRRMKAAA
jgi:hypothetical protein